MLVGHLNYAAIVIPMARYFFGRIRRLINRKYRKNQVIQLSKEVLADLTLWIRFLLKAHDGISINLLVECYPDHIYITDLYENGIGGYSLLTGKA